MIGRSVVRRVAGLGLAFAALAALSAAGPNLEAQEEKPIAPGVDYWQPDWMVRELWGPGHMPRGMMVRLLRHTTYMQYGVPKAYEGKQPMAVKGPDAVAAGRALFAQNCAGCHGANGLGNGVSANALSPSPALLAYMIRRPIAVDEYLLWTISEGGAQFDSSMPAFKDKLSNDDIWRVVAYMRAGFPPDGGADVPAPKDKPKP